MTIRKLEELGRDELLTTVRSLLAEAEALSSRIAAINEIGIAINRTFDLDEILHVVSRQAKWLLDYDYAGVCLPESQTGDSWRVVTLFGPALNLDSAALASSPNLGYVLQTGQSQLVRDGADSPFLNHYPSQIILPLTSDASVQGALIFASSTAQRYTQEDLRIGYLLALQLASALRNARQFEQLKQAKAELQLYAQELEESNRELDAYNHTIAHDLKSPITGIVLKAELIKLMGKDLPPSLLAQLDDIKGSMLKMSDMIEQLLWLTRLRDAAASAEPVDVQSVVPNALARFAPQIERGSITIEVDPDLPPALAHQQWLEEVFANLVSNAIKYMGDNNPDPRIIITGSRQDSLVHFEIHDTGVGIAPEDQQRLFAMFTRLHTVKADGLGLGLSIVQRIITKLNGQIGVESQPGQGAIFWFTLPAGDVQPASNAAAALNV